jgi:hypothetical protein
VRGARVANHAARARDQGASAAAKSAAARSTRGTQSRSIAWYLGSKADQLLGQLSGYVSKSAEGDVKPTVVLEHIPAGPVGGAEKDDVEV